MSVSSAVSSAIPHAHQAHERIHLVLDLPGPRGESRRDQAAFAIVIVFERSRASLTSRGCLFTMLIRAESDDAYERGVARRRRSI